MKSIKFDISRERFHPVWLVAGLIIGRTFGYVTGMNLSSWYFANMSAVVVWQIIGAIFTALIISFMMTSDLVRQVKYALFGYGAGFALALYGGEIWGLSHDGLSGLTAGEGVYFEWLLLHGGFLGAAVGFITGHVTSKRITGSTTSEELPN